ncbi:MAG: Flp pilus assembly complex ATPase component TadA [Acidimicrobiia bacterium]|nr:Flp pilus assembly complex ATPase component TadA [Acidimicrobiia bacterium]MBT8192227.1 Flp pilus assembly complex ATPase component TadA [Acidimicrobiia bacterium]NNF88571.1 Flp pilus assembly complex ATPase component TadA [Acidimicrobiia bacterium]NNJ48540.1 Flp pilus assembly complex ATPase component TadA [Acidimicrobiia bacterium]NNL14536.1 Flp pilus assembly complex ATPase component TadA [Acidimicrobiia bacterium]
MLLQEGLLSRADLDRATEIQAETSLPLGRILVEEGFVKETDLVKTLAHHIGLEFVSLDEVSIDPSATALVPEALARRYAAIPIGFEDGSLIVAMADPANVLAIDDIRAITGMDVLPKVATRTEVEDAISRMAQFDDAVSDLGELLDDQAEVEDLSSMEASIEEAPVVKLVNTIITRAINERASDIHIEPGEKELRVRFRIDGVLHEAMSTPRTITNAMVSRLKIMADINIAERRIPQDGRISLKVQGSQIDLRVATLPSVYGEKVVLRILDRSSILLELSDLGFSEHNLERFESSYTKPYGAILVTGPTGSGKSTTLYATLNVLNRPEVNIITTEDPVEYRLAGITQVQVNRKAGLTFASALRSILRADPDIALIGEIRDRETAQIAIEAALTGHLVLSTLHTNDSSSSIGRLIEMDVEPYLVASSIDAVLAQRLARRLCEKCRVSGPPDTERFESASIEVPKEMYLPGGCTACANTGYRGRMALHEVLLVSEDIQRMAVERRPSDEIQKIAIEQGMTTLWQDGLAKVAAGMTSMEEIMRVVA